MCFALPNWAQPDLRSHLGGRKSFDAESDNEFPLAAQRQLALIADALGVPVSVFTDGEKGPADTEGAIELQRLWAISKAATSGNSFSASHAILFGRDRLRLMSIDTAKPKRPAGGDALGNRVAGSTRDKIERTQKAIREINEQIERGTDNIAAAKRLLKRSAGKLGAGEAGT